MDSELRKRNQTAESWAQMIRRTGQIPKNLPGDKKLFHTLTFIPGDRVNHLLGEDGEQKVPATIARVYTPVYDRHLEMAVIQYDEDETSTQHKVQIFRKAVMSQGKMYIAFNLELI